MSIQIYVVKSEFNHNLGIIPACLTLDYTFTAQDASFSVL